MKTFRLESLADKIKPLSLIVQFRLSIDKASHKVVSKKTTLGLNLTLTIPNYIIRIRC
jgi:hypothetical protein